MQTEKPSTIEQKESVEYERLQAFSPIVSWLHGLRYANMKSVFAEFARNHTGKRHRILDIGCGTAKLYTILDKMSQIDYVGYEIFSVFVDLAIRRYGARTNFRLVPSSIMDAKLEEMQGFDVIVALESLEHIPEHEVVRLVEKVAAARPKLFICSVPVEIGPALWMKNFGSKMCGYCRHTEYSWTETLWAGLYKLDRLPPHGIRHKGFDWRWLAQTVRHNMRVREVRCFPFRVMPAAFSTSVFMIAEPRD